MKRLIAIALFVSTSIGFTACSSDDDPIPVDDKYPGTWVTNKVSYNFGGIYMEHPYTDMPGDAEVTQNDELVLTEDTAVLTEYFKNKEGEPTVTLGTIENNVITFEKEDYTLRTIKPIVGGQLILVYDFTERGYTMPITVTYNRK